MFSYFVNIGDKEILVKGGSHAAIIKLRLLLKAKGKITIYEDNPAPEISEELTSRQPRAQQIEPRDSDTFDFA